jgi:tetraacyldisaccharide 4'-kinase
MAQSRLEAFFLREWAHASAWQIVLQPLSWGYAFATMVRRALYRLGVLHRRRVGVPVIVVGNVSVGGTGKTPVVIALCLWLKRRGFKPGVVSRGYVRGAAKTLDGTLVRRNPAQPAADAECDEADLIAGRTGVTVSIHRDRVVAAQRLLASDPSINIIVCDDGLQHYALERDLEIAVVDGSRGFGNGALLPAGPLREPVWRLFEADAVVVNGSGRRFKQAMPEMFAITLGNERFVPVRGGAEVGIEAFREQAAQKRIHALAGIGNPGRFFSQVHRMGLVTRDHVFDDHHVYSKHDIALPDADIVLMTEKDAVKCRSFADARHWFMRVDAMMPDAFFAKVAKRLEEKRKDHGHRPKTA